MKRDEATLGCNSLRGADHDADQRAGAPQHSLQSDRELGAADCDPLLPLMKVALDTIPDGILITDDDGAIRYCNQSYATLWKLDPAEIRTGENHRAIIARCAPHARDHDKIRARIEEIYSMPADDCLDVLELMDGRTIERISRVRRIDGRNAGRVWIFRDLTERRLAEDALRDETRVLDLLNQTGMAIGSNLELSSLLQAVTDAATQLSGAAFGAFFYNTVDESGEAFMLYTLSGAPREAFEHFGHPRATPLFGPTFNGESPIRIADVKKDPRYGQMGPYHGMPPGHLPVRSYLAVPVISRTGEVIGGLFFGHPDPDVFTERAERIILGIAAQAAVGIDNARLYDDVRRAGRERERLLAAERTARTEAERVSLMKDEFLATLSHELRTPLNAILGWAQLLTSHDIDEGELELGLETIERNARAQTRLIEDLLEMSRIVSGKVRLDVQPTDLVTVIDSAVEAIRFSADSKSVTVRTILDPLAAPVSGDPTRLQQIVWNLASNAVKFTPKGGKVEIRLARVNSHIELAVSDTGVGISPEFLPHVFERFRQADSSTTRKHAGLGIGLSIAKQLTELHGGTLRAQSKGTGEGSTFILSLPLAPIRDAASGEHPASRRDTKVHFEPVELDGISVLVVDDDADSRDYIARILKQSGANVAIAASADEAFDIVKHRRPDVIVSDVGMPDKDGYDFIREVRSLPQSAGGATPAIALTAFARSEDRTRAMLAGYQVHVSKPIEAPELIATVGSLTGRTGPRKGESASE